MFLIRNVLKKGDALLPIFSNFALQYAIRNVQINPDNLKLNGTHNLVVYIYLLQLGCYSVAVIILHVNKT